MWVQSLEKGRPTGGGRMDRGAWWATVHRVTKSRTQLKWLSMHVCILTATGKICCHHTYLLLNTLVIWLCILMLTLSQLTLKSLTNPSLSSEPWTPRAREGGRERPKEVWCLTSQTTASTPTSSKINVESQSLGFSSPWVYLRCGSSGKRFRISHFWKPSRCQLQYLLQTFASLHMHIYKCLSSYIL